MQSLKLQIQILLNECLKTLSHAFRNLLKVTIKFELCRMLVMQYVGNVRCWVCEILGMWDVDHVGYLGCEMLGMWDVGDV